MSAIYSIAPLEVKMMALDLIKQYHVDLETAEVKVDYVFAHAKLNNDGEVTAPPIMHQGYPAAGLARIIPLKDRVKGFGDCEILIDAEQWTVMSKERQKALLDHELYHFEVCRDKLGAFLFDDHHRPKLKMRKHDRQFGWFDEIARRHGMHSGEMNDMRVLHDEAGQIYFSFLKEPSLL